MQEIISRGGEKISPFEIENILVGHPAVKDLICFSAPHDPLDEVGRSASSDRDVGDVNTSRLVRWWVQLWY